jgi:hypothetical protein
METAFEAADALLAVGVQRDFCAGRAGLTGGA